MNFHPAILIDTREQAPLIFSRFPSERARLSVADRGIRGEGRHKEASTGAVPVGVVVKEVMADIAAARKSLA